MKKYFYSDGKEKYGPLSLDELKQEGISKQTLIWFKGLTIGHKQENLMMETHFRTQPPPISTEEKETIERWRKRNLLQTQKIKIGRPVKVFSSPFSFDGRIRRTEYGISFIIWYNSQ